ncbi:DUF4268 domain-containing protein [Cytophaga sp. FL35]|uniref:DUF4268 domain-containing protein n=1 Tax=Cytophaga sp. FL35 TaxID=1904456 RepID=UPI00165371A1|nr:DUF4268 domain-containing protein [Cytophaga sp. FL35]MBC6997862.1 DUF4268 domain-containing protein [Cytophaga sp. FL35]
MFSREESKKLREEFWIAFGKSYPKKWILYNTKIKGLSLKFHFDTKKAMVLLDVETDDLERRIELWEKIQSLRSLLTSEDYLPNAQFEDIYFLENGKEISRVFVMKENVSIHNKNTWQETMVFLSVSMLHLETFFTDFKEILSS